MSSLKLLIVFVLAVAGIFNVQALPLSCQGFPTGFDKKDGINYWQKRENYCGGIPDHLVVYYYTHYLDAYSKKDYQRSYGDDSAGFAYNAKFNQSRVADFMKLYSWTPDKDIPDLPTWGLIDYKVLEDFAIKKFTRENFDMKLENMKGTFEFLREESKKIQEQFHDNLSKILPVASSTKEIDIEEFKGLFLTKIKSNWANILAQVIYSRYLYLLENKGALLQLLSNYYENTPEGMKRHKDDLHKEWLDLMSSNFYFVQARPTFEGPFKSLENEFEALTLKPEYKAVADAIDQYHKIPKTSKDAIPVRIKALNHIVNLTEKFKEPLMKQIAQRARLKANYIAKLPAIEKQAETLAFRLPKKPGASIVALKEDVWKDLDPAKRDGLAELIPQWYALVKEDPSTPPFFLWLESQNTNSLMNDLRHSFLSLEQKRVRFEGPIAYNDIFTETKKKKVADGRYAYNIDEEGELYILPTFETQEKFVKLLPELFTSKNLDNDSLQQVLNHDVILGHLTVSSAGVVEFKDGKIIKIDTNSGHYKPFMIRHLRPALKALLQKHPDAIDANTLIGDYEGRVKMPYSQFLKATPEEVFEKPGATLEEIQAWKKRAIESRGELAVRKLQKGLKERYGNKDEKLTK